MGLGKPGSRSEFTERAGPEGVTPWPGRTALTLTVTSKGSPPRGADRRPACLPPPPPRGLLPPSPRPQHLGWTIIHNWGDRGARLSPWAGATPEGCPDAGECAEREAGAGSGPGTGLEGGSEEGGAGGPGSEAGRLFWGKGALLPGSRREDAFPLAWCDRLQGPAHGGRTHVGT